MRNSSNPFMNESGLIQKYLGTAYDNVKAVAEKLKEIQHLSDNMESIYDFASAKEAFEAFLENPDFLQWLIDNKESLDDLSELLASLVQNYAPLAGASFTGFTQLGERGIATKQVHFSGSTPVIGATNIWPHGVSISKIVGISGVVLGLHGEVESFSGETVKVRIWCDDENLRIAVDEEATDWGNRPFNVILTIIE